jgi:exopolysaccharide production protein ExoZ
MFAHTSGYSRFFTDYVNPYIPNGGYGLFLFFTISGYCILAAIEANPDQGFLNYGIRRSLRIYPTFWAALGLSYLLYLLTIVTGTRMVTASDGMPTLTGWLSILTLTQINFGIDCPINGVVWTLSYEIHFYLAMGLLLFLPRKHWPWFLVFLTAIATLHRIFPGIQARTPAFLYHFPEFAVGTAVLACRLPNFPKCYAPAIFVMLAILSIVEFGEFVQPYGDKPDLIQAKYGVLVSLAFALLLIFLHRWDMAFSQNRIVRWFSFAGLFSYSLYLIHYPFVARLSKLAGRFVDLDNNPIWAISVFVIVQIAVGFLSYWCYRIIELPSQRWYQNYGKIPTRLPSPTQDS